jgi:peptidoglycan hydrolase-like protein with peptidoglycan-binding domain
MKGIYKVAESLRTLKLKNPYMRGDDVKDLQESLKKLKYNAGKIDGVFGSITKSAVIAFQSDVKKTNKKMLVDGVVGSQTRDAINKALNALLKPPAPSPDMVDYLPIKDYPQVDSLILFKINAELQSVSEIRRKVVQEALKMVYPYGLYIRGANSYDKSLKPYYATVAMIKAGAKRQPEYYNGGREEWMIDHVEKLENKKEKCFAADCSGLVVGIWRKLGIVDNGFDNTANGILANSCYKISKADLKPADCVGSNQHMGLYLGAGYTLEDGGGAMAVQIASVDRTRLINKMKTEKYNKTYYSSKSRWSKFGRPKKY